VAETVDGRRRLAVVIARYAAAAPPGIDQIAFAAASLADTYEVIADLVDVDSAIAGPESVEELLWPGARRFPADWGVAELVGAADGYDEVVVVPADVPDLPGLVLAKVFRALQRAEVCVAPDRHGEGCVAIGVRRPTASWLPSSLTLDTSPVATLALAAPRRNLVAVAPDWHRLTSPAGVHRLDPGLEGWDETRALLSGRALTPG
jgi:Uncharacterized protein conserved in bacteria (DUF2064)